MKNMLIAIISAGICFIPFIVCGQSLLMCGACSELEDAFLDKPNVLMEQKNNETQVSGRSASNKVEEKGNKLTENEKWKTRLEAVLDIPESPVPEGILLEMLKSSGSKFLVAVYKTGEENIVYKARQIIWPKIRMLFVGSETPLVHAMPVSGGTFSAGSSFYTIINEVNGFNVFYMPHGSAKKMSLVFSGEEGTMLTPEGFVCRIIKYVPNAKEDK